MPGRDAREPEAGAVRVPGRAQVLGTGRMAGWAQAPGRETTVRRLGTDSNMASRGTVE